jgi:adenylate cyclase
VGPFAGAGSGAGATAPGRGLIGLGDGVMFRFDRPGDAVAAALAMVAGAPAAGLPAAHAGVHAGPLIERDGDFYGHTVNLAARIAGRAVSGEVLVSEAVRNAVSDGATSFEPLEPVALKGIANPIPLFRASRQSASTPDGWN